MVDESKNGETNDDEAAPVDELVMPTCETCGYWKFGYEIEHGDDDLPYCTELRFWINMMGTTYPHTPADFGCVKHSALEN